MSYSSTLMLQLAEEGRLDLEKEVAPLVDWEVDPALRIRHVLSHTSGGTGLQGRVADLLARLR